MKVAFIIPSISAGGAERVVVRLANYLVSQAIEVFIFVQRQGDIDYGLSPLASVKELSSLDAENVLSAVKKYKISLISDHYHWSLPHIREMQKVAQSGVKFILSEHNSYFYPLFQVATEGKKSSLDLHYARPEIYKSFSAVTALTRYSSQLLISEGLNQVVLMYNPVSYETDVTSSLSAPRVLTISSFVKPAKRLDRMLKAFTEVNQSYPGAKLRIVGALDYGRYKLYCRESGIIQSSVEVTGLSNSVIDHYLASSVFAMTSEIEGQPMVLLEAASHGVPQVVYDIPGIEDQIIDGETGYIVKPEDTRAFADRTVKLLRDPAARHRMGQRAAEFVLERFNLEAVGQRWLRLLESVHQTGKPPADMVWSANSPEAKGLRTDSTLELNRWFQRVLRPEVQPVVSVIVPVYGTEDYLARCIESLQAQTLKEIEIIVVNDASPGNASEIVSHFANSDPRIVYVEHQRNRGLYQARSTGARISRGAFLAHVDSDDYVHPDFLRKMYETALFTGADIVECAAVEISHDGQRKSFSSTEPGVLDQRELLDAFIDEKMRHVVWNKLYRKAAWDRAPLHMEEERSFSITEDLLRNAPIFATARKYVFISNVLYYYLRRPASVVTEGDYDKMLAKLEDITYVYAKIASLFNNLGVSEEGLGKLRRRQAQDLAWYFARGFNPEAGFGEENFDKAFAALGPIGAVAAKQSAEAARLQDFERKFWAIVHESDALKEKVAALQRAYEEAEAGRRWELARANELQSRLAAAPGREES